MTVTVSEAALERSKRLGWRMKEYRVLMID
jgi:hypothetical protein